MQVVSNPVDVKAFMESIVPNSNPPMTYSQLTGGPANPSVDIASIRFVGEDDAGYLYMNILDTMTNDKIQVRLNASPGSYAVAPAAASPNSGEPNAGTVPATQVESRYELAMVTGSYVAWNRLTNSVRFFPQSWLCICVT